MVNVLCVDSGTRYGADDVNRLRSMGARHFQRPHRFVCLTDDATACGAGRCRGSCRRASRPGRH